jgi:hypothetical protein
MTDEIILRPAQPRDFAFCERVYFDEMGWIIEALKLDLARHRDGFTRQWQCAEVRMISTGIGHVGFDRSTKRRMSHGQATRSIFGRARVTQTVRPCLSGSGT